MTSTAPQPAALPSIFDIGRHIRETYRLRDAADDRAVSLTGRAETIATAERDRYFEQAMALAELVKAGTARTLGDAAVQCAHAFYELDGLDSMDIHGADLDAGVSRVKHIVGSVLAVVAEAAGIALDDIGYGDLADLLEARGLPPRAAPAGDAAAT